MVAASRSDRVSRRWAASPASASSSWARRRRTSASAVRVAASAPATARSRAAIAASRSASAARSALRASPSRWRSTLWSPATRSSSSRRWSAFRGGHLRLQGRDLCGETAELGPALAVAGVLGRQCLGDHVDPGLPPLLTRQPGARRDVQRIVGARDRCDLHGRVPAERVVAERVPDQRSPEPGPPRRREPGHLPQGRWHRGDRGQDRRHEGHHPQAEALGQGGRVGHEQPVTRRPGQWWDRRRCRRPRGRPARWRPSRPHQRHDTVSTDSSSTVCSSTRW